MSNWIPTTNNTFDALAEVFDNAEDPEVRITLGVSFKAADAAHPGADATETLRSFAVQADRFCITGYLVQYHSVQPRPTGQGSLFFAGTGQQVAISSDYGTTPARHSYSLLGDGVGVVYSARVGDGSYDDLLTALYEWAARYARNHLGVAL